MFLSIINKLSYIYIINWWNLTSVLAGLRYRIACSLLSLGCWLVFWLVCWLVFWLVCWLVCWLVFWLVCWLVCWLMDCLLLFSCFCSAACCISALGDLLRVPSSGCLLLGSSLSSLLVVCFWAASSFLVVCCLLLGSFLSRRHLLAGGLLSFCLRAGYKVKLGFLGKRWIRELLNSIKELN